MNNITAKLGEYRGVRFVMGRTQQRDDNTVVSTVVERPNNPPTNVDWIIGNAASNPKIIDVIAEGTSLRLTQRQDYASYLSRNNNNIDALINAMRQQVAQAGYSRDSSGTSPCASPAARSCRIRSCRCRPAPCARQSCFPARPRRCAAARPARDRSAARRRPPRAPGRGPAPRAIARSASATPRPSGRRSKPVMPINAALPRSRIVHMPKPLAPQDRSLSRVPRPSVPAFARRPT